MNAIEPALGAVSPGTSPARPRVLLVDDEEVLLMVFRLGLEREFDVETASSAAEAARKMDECDFDAIVCDHRMPGLTGAEFLLEASLRHPRTRRIMLTGYVNPDLLAKTVTEAGLSAWLSKPLKIQTLAQTIRAAVSEN